MRDQHVLEHDQHDLLRPLFMKRASVASSLSTVVRTVLTFLSWADAANVDPWSIGAEKLAFYLRDAGRRGTSVPRALWFALDWAREVFELPWPLSDPIVVAQKHLSGIKSEEAREQAPPLTQAMLEALLD
eukprot:11158318-Karenia_brevis.AAC.1